MTYDVVVIGGGAAGLNAALVLGRMGKRVAVVDAGEPRNAPAVHMHGFLSRDGMSPMDLLAIGRDEVRGYGGELIGDRVLAVEPGFTVTLASGNTLRARRILVTTGLRDDIPDIPGLRERWGNDVAHCPFCHGHEFAGRKVGVVGVTAHQALLMRGLSADVTVVTNGAAMPDDVRNELRAMDVRVVDAKIERVVVGADAVRGLALADGTTVDVDVVFVPPTFVPNGSLLELLGCAVDANGWVVVDAFGATSVPGVWAAGNVVDPMAQVINAAAAGGRAAAGIVRSLLEEDVQRALAAS